MGRRRRRVVGASQLVDDVTTQSRVHELGGTVVVVDVVHAAGSSAALLPTGGQRTERLLRHVLVARNTRIVPCADAGGLVVEIDLSLDSGAHF